MTSRARVTTRRLAAAVAAAMLVVVLTGGRAHPVHVTLTEVAYVAANRSVVLSIRTFADDLTAAARKHAGLTAAPDDAVTDSAAFAYARANLSVKSERGQAIPLRWCGSRREGDLLWLCMRAIDVADPRRAQMRNTLLFDLFDDQVNIVQRIDRGRRHTLVFTKNDAYKRLP
ncbi:MAG: DUF6702 family protein [Gemmatimonadaceae bacterium]